jgi:hypothetical protein
MHGAKKYFILLFINIVFPFQGVSAVQTGVVCVAA